MKYQEHRASTQIFWFLYKKCNKTVGQLQPVRKTKPRGKANAVWIFFLMFGILGFFGIFESLGFLRFLLFSFFLELLGFCLNFLNFRDFLHFSERCTGFFE